MTAVLVACITFFSTGVGGLAGVRLRDRLHLLLGFSSGAVLGVVIFDLLPEVFRQNPPDYVLLPTAAGFLLFFGLERYTAFHSASKHEHAEREHEPELGVLGAAGLSFHSFLDGFAIGVGFQVSTPLGILVALAVIAHDFSDGLNTVTVMLAHGNDIRRVVTWLLIDMTTPILGAATTLFFHIPGGLLPWILAFTVGFFLYIGASDLLPEAREHDSPMIPVMTLLGLVVLFAVTRLL